MKHAELVERAERWLRNTRGCGVVLTEFVAHTSEEPDALGWREGGRWSILVECKASRADFRADQQKPSRRRQAGPTSAAILGVRFRIGKERWYMTPPGLVRPDEVPEGWGLLEVRGRQVRAVVKPPEMRGNGFAWTGSVDGYHQITANEMPFLYSALRRHHCRSCFKDINSRRAGDAGAEREPISGRSEGLIAPDRGRHPGSVPLEGGSEWSDLPPEGAA